MSARNGPPSLAAALAGPVRRREAALRRAHPYPVRPGAPNPAAIDRCCVPDLPITRQALGRLDERRGGARRDGHPTRDPVPVGAAARRWS